MYTYTLEQLEPIQMIYFPSIFAYYNYKLFVLFYDSIATKDKQWNSNLADCLRHQQNVPDFGVVRYIWISLLLFFQNGLREKSV